MQARVHARVCIHAVAASEIPRSTECVGAAEILGLPTKAGAQIVLFSQLLMAAPQRATGLLTLPSGSPVLQELNEARSLNARHVSRILQIAHICAVGKLEQGLAHTISVVFPLVPRFEPTPNRVPKNLNNREFL